MTQDKLRNLLKQEPVRKGHPLELSTTEQVIDDSAPSHHRTIAPAQQFKRTKRGYALRDDLVKACKQIALDRDITLYEVMEAALEAYLEIQKSEQAQAEPAPHVEQPAPAPAPTPAQPRFVLSGQPVPDDLTDILLWKVADLHGIARNEAERLWKMGMIAGARVVGKGVLLYPKGLRDFWIQCHDLPGFRACDDCPHK